MTAVSFRMQQCAISLIGTLLFLPVYIFWGGVFSFSITLLDSVWAWGFGLTACWSQILAMMFSFIQPRKAAYWMMANTGVSILLTIGQLAESAQTRAIKFSGLALWPYGHANFWKTGVIFWALPIFFALLFLRREPPVEEDQPEQLSRRTAAKLSAR